jgi:hypothetical protein
VKTILADFRRALADADLADYDGITRWTEDVRYGGLVHCTLNGRHLAAVLAARPAYLATKPRLRLTVPGLRLVRPAKIKGEGEARSA